MSEATRAELSQRIETIESGYEFLLAYAAQGRQDDAGTNVRETLVQMQSALDGLGDALEDLLGPDRTDLAPFIEAVRRDASVARGALTLVTSRAAIGSLLVDNLNASVHLRALLTDLFLIEQALKAPPQGM